MNPARWLSAIILYTVITLILAYFTSSDSMLVILSSLLGFAFVAFLPGYCLTSLIFPEGKLDPVEIVVLSVALSFSIAGISGLFLGLSPIGINVISVILALSSIVVILAILVFLKKMNLLNVHRRKLQVNTPVKVTE